MANWVEYAYREHRQAMLQVAWFVLRDHQLAEDAVHAAVLRLVHRPEPQESHRSYVLAAVRNAAVDSFRQSCRRRERSFGDGPVAEPHAVDADDQFADLMSKLASEKQEILQLKLQLGLSFREIAEIVGQPISTISSRYERAIRELRELLDDSNE